MLDVLKNVMPWVGAPIVVYITHLFQRSREKKLRDREARIRLFGTLMGNKLLLSQLYVSAFEARINSDYNERRWHLAGAPPDSLDCKETQRWMHKSEDLGLEIARAHPDLCRAVASARILFPSCPELLTLTDAVYNHAVPSLAKLKPNMGSAELENWRTEAVRQVQQLVKEIIEKPIDSLTEYLEPRVC